MTDTVTMHVYIDNGIVYKYDVTSAESAREHADAIIKTGYRHTKPGTMVHWPPHSILKVKCVGDGIDTKYPDTVSGT